MARPVTGDVGLAVQMYKDGATVDDAAAFAGCKRSTVMSRVSGLRPRKVGTCIEFNGKRYYPSDKGYWRCTSRKLGQSYLHKDIWMAKNGPIPPKHHVHHIDHDKDNNPIDCSNFELIDDAGHQRYHINERNARKEQNHGIAQ